MSNNQPLLDFYGIKTNMVDYLRSRLMMIRFSFFLCLLLTSSVINGSYAQLAPERLAWSNLGKEKWTKAKLQVRKALRKDSLNVTAHYVYAWYLFSTACPDFNIDSASHQTNKTSRLFTALSSRERERLLRFPLDSVLLGKLRFYIDSAAFERAKKLNSVAGYHYFIQHFSSAASIPQAKELEQEVAFLDALKKNTYQGFHEFLTHYPQSHRAAEAQKRYDRLLFDSFTKDKRLASYELFLKEHPETPFRSEVEQQIFEISTADGSVEAFERFVSIHSDNRFIRQAKDFLLASFISSDLDIPDYLLTDSVRHLMMLNKRVWFPLWKNGSYSFMDDGGTEYLTGVGDSLSSDILCTGLQDDLVLIAGKLFARNGTIVAKDVVDFHYLERGLIKVTRANSYCILLRSGVVLLESSDDISMVGDRFLLVKHNGSSALYTLSGRKLLVDKWDRVMALSFGLAFQSKGGWKLASYASVGAVANGIPLVYSDLYDEVKVFNDAYSWVRQDSKQGLLSNSMEFAIPLKEHMIANDQYVTTVADASGIYLFMNGNSSPAFSKLTVYPDWIIGKRNGQFRLLTKSLTLSSSIEFDSLFVVSPVAIGLAKDSTFVFTPFTRFSFAGSPLLEFLSAPDSTFICISLRDQKTVLSLDGKKLFSVVCDKIEYLGGGFFMYSKRDRKTIVGVDGKMISAIDFDALGNVNENSIATLLKKKFGILNSVMKKEIKPQYERSIVPFSKDILVAFRDKAYGFIDWNNKPVSKFEFEEIRHWNDSVALVKQNFSWRFYDLKKHLLIPDGFSNYEPFSTNAGETIAIYKQDNYYGVMSSSQGIILDPVFTDIINLGSADAPLYFTEKYIEEAAIFIVIYYDGNGKQLRRQVFEEAEYDKIKCLD